MNEDGYDPNDLRVLDEMLEGIGATGLTIQTNDHGGTDVKIYLSVTHPMYGNYASVSLPYFGMGAAITQAVRQAKGIINSMDKN